ncbi:uncharacterized protein LOC113281780 [Papaver somniferum]|nr:uncharacterized protein LOC113281780 [Papaver somniferum]
MKRIMSFHVSTIDNQKTTVINYLRFLRFQPAVMSIRILCFSVGGDESFCKSQGGKSIINVTELPDEAHKVIETHIPAVIPRSTWVSSSASIEASTLEEAGKLSFFPEVSEAGCSKRDLVQHDELYTALLNSPPPKLVPVGSDHQAIIPQCTGSNVMADNSNLENLVGTCLLPLSDSEALFSDILERVDQIIVFAQIRVA